MLAEAGYEIVPFSEAADVYVINTCTVTNTADKKSRQMIHRAKKKNPDAIVVAAGCYVQVSAEKTEADDAVDIILGNDEKNNLIALIRDFETKNSGKVHPERSGEEAGQAVSGREKTVCVTDIDAPGLPYEELSVSHPAEHTRAFVKIQDGCNSFCSYCIIPYARGRARSRKPEQVLREVETLAENGYLEIVLTGIHISSYGPDVGSSLAELIRMIHDVDGIRRIRLSSMEPGIITEEFVSEIAGMDKVCPHFHLSLQSGSDSVLKRMNRKYTASGYLDKCALLRKYFDHPAITTDVITGFPGETDEEFSETCDLVRKAALYEIHVFPYSRREGTAAAQMDGQIPRSIKEERSARMLEIAAGLKEEFERWYEGRTVEVLFEGPVTEDGVMYNVGFTPEYVKVRCPGVEPYTNRIMKVEFFR